MKTLCLLKFSALGDLAQIEPFLPSLSETFEITFFTTQIGYEYYRSSPYIKKFILLKSKKIHHLFATIPQFCAQFDYFVDLQGNDRSKFLSLFALTKRVGNYTRHFRIAAIPVSLEAYIAPQSVYHVDLYSILSQLPIHFQFMPYKVKKQEYIVLNCGSSPKWISKRLPIEKWHEIATILYERYKLPLVMTGEKNEEPYINEIAQQWEYPTKILAGKTSLQDLKKLLNDALLVISTDSASLHIASAQGTPSIGIFGATSWIYAKPFGPWSIAIFDTNYYPNQIPPKYNQQEVGPYYDHINLLPALDALRTYLS